MQPAQQHSAAKGVTNQTRSDQSRHNILLDITGKFREMCMADQLQVLMFCMEAVTCWCGGG
jgi:hypothetical protein